MSEIKVADNNGISAIIIPKRLYADNAPTFGEEVLSYLEKNEIQKLDFDASDTEYISSAGLRIFLMIKQKGYDFEIINVNKDVYDIFEITGFSDILKIRRKMREVSVEGLEMIGMGATAKVYRLDQDKIIKVFSDVYSLSDIVTEMDRTKQAFIKGIVTAISYDVVKVGDSYGTIYEMLNAKTLSEEFNSNPDKEDHYVEQYVNFMKRMNSIRIDKEFFTSSKKHYIGRLHMFKDRIAPEIFDRMCAMIEAIPDAEFFVHGDFHPKNVMYENDAPILIDMGGTTYGHPIFDIMSFGVLRLFAPVVPDEFAFQFAGMSKEQVLRVWDKFIKIYYPTDDEEKFKKFECVCLCYSAIRCWMIACLVSSFPEELVKYAIGAFQKYYEAGGNDTEILAWITEQ